MRNIIFGPPGTGKTTHLLRIVEKELKENNVPPNKIAYLAFTNQAADEALSRAISQLNYSIKDFMNFRTLHSLAYRELHLREENIMSDEDYEAQLSLSKNIENVGTNYKLTSVQAAVGINQLKKLNKPVYVSTGHGAADKNIKKCLNAFGIMKKKIVI